jgi:2-methylcitrate dehydratase PrpD
MKMSNPLLTLAKVAADWRQRALSDDIEWSTRRAVLDWFATTLPGCLLSPATNLAEAMGPGRGPGNAVSYVDGKMGDARTAALLNATASHIVEFDDIFKDGGYHPGTSTIAAALALAQDRQVSLEQFHRAIIAGYEIGCRIALAIQPSHYTFWHTTATVGTIGSAVAAAMILDCEERAITHAIALATSFAGGHQQNLQGEGMAKALHPGHAADAGILAALAAANGVTGSIDSLDGAKGYAAATSVSSGNWELALDRIGVWTPISHMTIKNHGCCGHIFPALDGLKYLFAENALSPDDIAAIHVAGYGATETMCNRPDPKTAQEARFSAQYCIAAQALTGAVRLGAFEPDILERPDIRAFMRKVSVTEDIELTSAYPGKRMAKIAVRLCDGQEITHFQKTRKGDPEDPLSDEELITKFDELAGSVLHKGALNDLRQTILNGTTLPGAAPLVAV